MATEGRSTPSLAQLDQAVREFIADNPADTVTVVVDASFGHRIDPSELSDFEAAEAAGEVVSPPAGAIGRGDAFLLRIAEKTGATVLSNDSFQEFHGEHTWLFDKGRLVGGKPVPGVGWIFMDRTPVRGAKSREVTKEAKRKKRPEVDTTSSHKGSGNTDTKAKSRPKAVDRAIARATEEVVEPKASSKARRRRSSAPPADPVNEPLAFITFIAAHPLGSDVVGSVLEYSSHGAFVEADGARCYIPLSAMASPPPRRAREVVVKGEMRPFVVQAFDPPRRGIELALPGFARIAGGPTAETVEAEISADIAPEPEPETKVLSGAAAAGGGVAASGVAADGAGGPGGVRKRAVKKAAPRAATAVVDEHPPAAAAAAAAARAPARRRVAKNAVPEVAEAVLAASDGPPAKKATIAKKTQAAKQAPAAAAKKAPATTATKAAAAAAPSAKKAAAPKAKKTSAVTAKKSPAAAVKKAKPPPEEVRGEKAVDRVTPVAAAKKSGAAKNAVPVKKSGAAKRAAPSKNAAPAVKSAAKKARSTTTA